MFNGTSTPKGSYSAKAGVNCTMSLYRVHWKRMLCFYSLRTALCESIRYQAKSEPNVRQDLIPRVRHGEAALVQPSSLGKLFTYVIMVLIHQSRVHTNLLPTLCFISATISYFHQFEGG